MTIDNMTDRELVAYGIELGIWSERTRLGVLVLNSREEIIESIEKELFLQQQAENAEYLDTYGYYAEADCGW